MCRTLTNKPSNQSDVDIPDERDRRQMPLPSKRSDDDDDDDDEVYRDRITVQLGATLTL